MKILYAIQGTGNGHLARAQEILPALERRAEVDLLISGMHAELHLDRPVRYRLKGLGFKFGRTGGVDYFNTWWHGDMPRFLREVRDLDVEQYDLVISDFEPVSAWAARRQHIPCVGLSNQCILLDGRVQKPAKKRHVDIGKAVLKHYAPVDVAYGFHYEAIPPFISTPIVRQSIRNIHSTTGAHYLVYLPAFHDAKIFNALKNFPKVPWIVFSKTCRKPYCESNITFHPIGDEVFQQSLASAKGVICAAGFSLTTEVLFLGKKLLVVPMKKQFEQQCNAAALKSLGITTIKSLRKKWFETIARWIKMQATLQVQYPDNAQDVVDQILLDYIGQTHLLQDAFVAETAEKGKRI